MPQANKPSSKGTSKTTKGAAPHKTPGLAIASLVLGLIALIPVIGVTPAILAIIFGSVSQKRNKEGKGMATAGIILGVAGILINVALLAFVITIASNVAEDPAGILKKIPGLDGCELDEAFTCESTIDESSITLSLTNDQPGTMTVTNAQALIAENLKDPETIVECEWEGQEALAREETTSIVLPCEGATNPEALIGLIITYEDALSREREATGAIIP